MGGKMGSGDTEMEGDEEGGVNDLVTRLRRLAETKDWIAGEEAAREIIRLRKIVDSLTVRLNAELTKTYGLEERLTTLEARVAVLAARVTH